MLYSFVEGRLNLIKLPETHIFAFEYVWLEDELLFSVFLADVQGRNSLV